MSSRAYRLKTDEDAAAGMRRIAAGRAEKALERLHGADQGELAAAIHGARKDLKKLRGLLRLVRDELGEKTFKAEDRRYRDAGRALSGSRDAEVKLETLLALRHRFDGTCPPTAAERWAGTLEAERDELAAVVVGETEGKIDAALGGDRGGADAIRGWTLETDSWELVGPGLDAELPARAARRWPRRWRTHRPRASTSGANAPRTSGTSCGSLRDAWPEPLGETTAEAHELTELLGDHHDLAVLGGRPRRRARARRPRPPSRPRSSGARRSFSTRRSPSAERLYAEKPKAFRRRHQALLARLARGLAAAARRHEPPVGADADGARSEVFGRERVDERRAAAFGIGDRLARFDQPHRGDPAGAKAPVGGRGWRGARPTAPSTPSSVKLW